jgi:predicted RNA-binding Zn ribbon-like protein
MSEDAASRAGTLALVGNDLALNFANTSSGRGTAQHIEHLRAPAHVLLWARHAGVLGRDDHDRLAGMVAGDPALAGRLLASARDLRDAIHAIAAAIAQGGEPDAAALARLASSYGACVARGRLVRSGDGYAFDWTLTEAPVEFVLGPIAVSALMLLTTRDLSRVKQCQGGNACGWVFLDVSKNGSRRWCEMEVCGNRSKQRRLAARRHGGRAD